jgi:hypothetical protein
LDRDNAIIAAGEQLARDHDLVRRAAWDETDAALYGYEGGLQGEYPAHLNHAMRLRLRPGEALEWRWDHRGKHHQAGRPLYALQSTHLKEHWGENAWEQLCNGRWIYAPDLRKASAEWGPATTNARWNRQLALPAVSPQAAGETATLVWKVETPYSLVGGELRVILRCRKGSSWALLFSYDNQDWKPVLSSSDRSETEVASSLDRFLPSQGPARYQYYLRIDLTAGRRATDVGLNGIVLQNDLQMARLSLPALELGDNKIVYSDETEEPHMLRVTYHWVERSGPPPPLPSAAPLFPEDGAEVEGSNLQFRWEKSQAGENAEIVDYQFQLCAEPLCRWALSSRFDLLVSSVAGTPVAEHSLLNPGLLNPGQRYWWRVRAKSGLGVWSPWSQTWSFVPQGPGIPLGLKMVRQDGDAVALEWEPNPRGRRPARYLVYGSDEKGFSPSDSPQTVYVGNQKDRGLFPGREQVVFPPSFLVETQETRMQLRPIHAFYRVVAEDAKGNRSGPSDWAAAPRPFIYTDPVREARVGVPYRYEARTIVSIGHLTYRDFPLGEFYQAAFWEAEKPRFSLVDEISRCGNKDPSWLHVDPETGVLTGVPGEEDVGEYQINLKVEIEGTGADILSFPLRVGK